MSATCSLTPSTKLDVGEAFVAALNLGGQRGVAKFGLTLHPFVERGVAWHVDVAGLHLGAVPKEIQRSGEGWETICPRVLE